MEKQNNFLEKKRIVGTKGIKQHLPAFLSLMEMAPHKDGAVFLQWSKADDSNAALQVTVFLISYFSCKKESFKIDH